jgi:hypothetical protein
MLFTFLHHLNSTFLFALFSYFHHFTISFTIILLCLASMSFYLLLQCLLSHSTSYYFLFTIFFVFSRFADLILMFLSYYFNLVLFILSVSCFICLIYGRFLFSVYFMFAFDFINIIANSRFLFYFLWFFFIRFVYDIHLILVIFERFIWDNWHKLYAECASETTTKDTIRNRDHKRWLFEQKQEQLSTGFPHPSHHTHHKRQMSPP